MSTLCFLALAAGGVFHIWISGNMVCVGHIRMSSWAICFAVMCLILSVWNVRTDFHIVSWMDQIQICKNREEKKWGWNSNNFVKTYIGEEMQYPVNICTLLLTSYLWLTSSQLHNLGENLLDQIQKFAVYADTWKSNRPHIFGVHGMAHVSCPTLRALGPALNVGKGRCLRLYLLSE